MKLKYLEFEAFLSYKNKVSIDFNDFENSIFLIDGDTGAGKTTIFDAIVFALYGEASDKDRDQHFKSDYATLEQKCYVKLIFEEEGKIYTVYREPNQKIKSTRKRNGEYYAMDSNASVTLEFDDQTLTRITECDQKIIEIIKLKKDQFRNIIMIGQNKFADLIRATTKERKELFRSILDTARFDNFKNAIADKYNKCKDENTASNTQIDTYLSSYKSDNEIIIEKLSKGKPSEIDFETLSTLLENDLNESKEKLEAEEIKKNTSKSELDKLNKEKTLGETNNKNIESYNKHKQSLDDILKDSDEYNKKKEIIDTYNDSLPSYNKHNEVIQKQKQIDAKTSELKNNERKHDTLTPLFNIAKENKDKVSSIEEDNKTLRDKLKDLNILKDDFDSLTKAKEDESKYREDISNTEGIITKESALLLEIENNITTLKAYNEENKNVSVDKEKLDTKKREFEGNIKDVTKSYNDLNNTITKDLEYKKTLESLNNTKTLKNEELNKINNSIKVCEEFKSSNNTIDTDINIINNDIKDIKTNIESLKDLTNKYNNLIKDKENLNKECSNEETLREEVNKLREIYELLYKQYKEGIVGNIASNIKEGEACPVCGNVHFVKLAPKVNEVSEDKVKEAENKHNEASKKLAGVESTNREKLNNLKKSLDDLNIGFKKLSKLDLSYEEGKDEYSDTLSKALTTKETLLKEKQELKDKVRVNDELLNKLNKDKEKLTKELNNLEIELTKEDSNLKNNFSKRDELFNDLNKYLNNPTLDNVNQLVNDYIKETQESLNTINSKIKKLEDIESKIHENNEKLIKLETDSKQKSEELTKHTAHLASLKTNLDNTIATIQTLNDKLKGKDKDTIISEINETTKKISDNDSLIKTYNDEYETRNKEYTALVTLIDSLTKEIKSLSIELDNLKDEEIKLINNTILKDINKIVEYFNTYKDSINDINNSYNEYQNKLNVAKSLVDEDLKNGYDKLLFKDLTILEETINNKDQEFKAIEDNYINLKTTYTNNLNSYNSYVTTYRSIESNSKKLSNLKKLYLVSNGQVTGKEKLDFETYYQSQVFNNILAEANKKLNIMTDNVYSLIRHESSDDKASTALDIDIFDTNTGKVRSANSLSGGEIFMASLSLALGFSEISRCKSGAHELDCMFIDEGFGTLDEEALRTVMKVLNQLSNEGNRTIGIISHVGELRDVISKQIHVTKDKSNGSHLEIIK